MKYNSYDIPAIKFYVTYGNKDNAFQKNKCIINFDTIDGLTLGEIKEIIYLTLIKEKGYYNCDNPDYNYIKISPLLNIENNINESKRIINLETMIPTIVIQLKDEFQNRRINEVMEEALLRSNIEDKKVIKCFLQRYRYNTMNEVDEVLASGKPKKRVRTPGE